MRSSLVSACVLLSVTSAPVFAGQDLGRLAAIEAARRQAIQRPAPVITEDQLLKATPPRPATEVPIAAGPEDDNRAPRVLVSPAKFASGAVPDVPVMAVSGGEVLLEVAVARTGRVTAVRPLRHTAPFTEAMAGAVRGWAFTPAEDAATPAPGLEPDPATRRRIDSTVLVVGLFRPPALFANTLGEPPMDVAKPSGATPFPLNALEMPAFPPKALNQGVVVIELTVASHGAINGAKVVKSAPPFDEPALGAASSLIFTPARVYNRSAAALVYVVAAFRPPVTF